MSHPAVLVVVVVVAATAAVVVPILLLQAGPHQACLQHRISFGILQNRVQHCGNVKCFL